MPGQKPEAKLLRLYSTADSFTIGYLRRYSPERLDPQDLHWVWNKRKWLPESDASTQASGC